MSEYMILFNSGVRVYVQGSNLDIKYYNAVRNEEQTFDIENGTLRTSDVSAVILFDRDNMEVHK